MTDISKVKPAPNWCPACGLRPDAPTLCIHPFHPPRPTTHLPNPGEIGSKSVDAAAPVVVELPEPAFRLRWDGNRAAYFVSKPNIGDADVYTTEQVASLARQLAEAEADTATATRCHAITRHHLEQAESQLAEATRRVAEVEGLVNDALALQEKHYGDGMETHLALIDWARGAKAALQKEPG